MVLLAEDEAGPSSISSSIDPQHRQEEQREQADAIRDALTHLAEEEAAPETDERKKTGESRDVPQQVDAIRDALTHLGLWLIRW